VRRLVLTLEGAVEPSITWYEVLGVLPRAHVREIQRGYDAKARLLRPELIAGAPSPVVTAASRAQAILDAAWGVLGDPAQRARYDERAGIRTIGGGLARRENIPSEPGWTAADFMLPASLTGAALLGGLQALTELLAPRPSEPRRVTVPDVRGLFYSVCSPAVSRLGLRVVAVRLTERPMPVDGLIVAQSPGPLAKTRRSGVLTVQVWHPPDRR
jgi:DnaJ domain